MSIVYIYGLECPKEKIIKYVGKSIRPKKRFNQHLARSVLNKKKKSNIHFVRWVDSLKLANLKPNLIILEETTSETWKAAEIKWIKFYKDLLGRKLCNVHEGGIEPPNCTGRKLSLEQRKAISNRKKGIPLWQDKPHPLLGVPCKRKGLKNNWTDENRKKISDYMLTSNPMKNKILTDIDIEKRIAWCRKKIKQTNSNGDIIKIWESAAEATRVLNLCVGAIQRCCKGKYSQTKGLYFSYY